jgi:uncharacterized protein
MAPSLTVAQQARMVAGLLERLRAQNPRVAVELIETHISFVLLAGELAYKIKKAVNPGFLDFTTLALRQHFCEEELRLNRRCAPALYLDVLPITGTPQQPTLGGSGAPIDWALKMRAFPQSGLWDRLARINALLPAHIDTLVESLCTLQDTAAVAGPDDPRGQAAMVREPMQDNLRALDALCSVPDERAELAELKRWEAQAFEALGPVFDRRLREGRVRECHGDLHLANVTLVDGRTTMFDCLEFSPELRWTDVMSDVAFMAMDLHAHGLARLAQRFVNACIERSGDHGGLRVLRYYTVHRALVRAKVAALRRDQLGARAPEAERVEAEKALRRYLDAALAATRHAEPVLMVTHGSSGSGKTALTQSLLELCGAIRIRADVERKRLFGLPALERSDAALKEKLYSSEATEATHARLREFATLALCGGYCVILDATFAEHEHRQRASLLAHGLGVRFVIIHFQASVPTLRERVGRRALLHNDASEADLAVLEDQLANAQPLRSAEQAAVFEFDAEPPLADADMAARWAPLLERLGLKWR